MNPNDSINVRMPYPQGAGVSDVSDLIRSIPLEHLHGMPSAEWFQKFKPSIIDAEEYSLRDKRLIAAGTSVPAAVYGFFDVPFGGKETSLDGSITVNPKTNRFTNIVTANRLEEGQVLIIDTIQVDVPLVTRDFTTFVNGEPSDLTPQAAVGVNASTNTLIGLIRDTQLTIKEGKDTIAEGRLSRFPPDGAISGMYGGNAIEGFTQIGQGYSRPLRQIYVLRPNRHFRAELEFFNSVIVPQNVEIEVSLKGFLLEDR